MGLVVCATVDGYTADVAAEDRVIESRHWWRPFRAVRFHAYNFCYVVAFHLRRT